MTGTSTVSARGMLVQLPIRVVSEANQSSPGAWRTKARRAKAQRAATCYGLRAHLGPSFSAAHVRVTLTRIGMNTLDDDNLAGAFKHVRDGVADWLEVDDGDRERVSWVYAQEATGKRVYGVRIALEVVR